MVRATGCAAVMIGRGALGAPWIFRGAHVPRDERARIIRRHCALIETHLAPRLALVQTQKHLAWYCHGLAGAASAREALFRAPTAAAAQDVFWGLWWRRRTVPPRDPPPAPPVRRRHLRHGRRAGGLRADARGRDARGPPAVRRRVHGPREPGVLRPHRPGGVRRAPRPPPPAGGRAGADAPAHGAADPPDARAHGADGGRARGAPPAPRRGLPPGRRLVVRARADPRHGGPAPPPASH